jgi:hypothetical protein
MIDLARAAVLTFAIVMAVKHRFREGIVLGLALAAAFAASFGVVHADMARGAVSGEYGVALAYIGPTMVPFGPRGISQWSPAFVQCALAALAGFPTLRALREPSNPVATPFLAVFIPNAMLAVLACLAAFLLWHQEALAPEYWQDHL